MADNAPAPNLPPPAGSPPGITPEQLARNIANSNIPPGEDSVTNANLKRATPQNIDPIRGENALDRASRPSAEPTPSEEADFARQLAEAQSNKPPAAPAAPAKPDAAPAKPDAAPPRTPAKPPGAVPNLDQLRPKTPVKAAQWDELKTSYEAKLQAAQAELAEARAKASTPPAELAALQKERDQYKDIVRSIAIERDPDFVSKFTAKREAVVNIVKNAAGPQAGAIASLLSQPASQWRDQQLDEAIKDLDSTAQRRISSALNVLEAIEIERETEIAQRRASFDATQEAKLFAGRAEQQRRAAALQATFDSQIKEWSDPQSGIEYFQAIEGNAEHNAAVNETRELAKRIYFGDSELTEQDMATAALWSAVAPRLAADLTRYAEENTQLKAELDRIRGASPGLGLSSAPGSAPASLPDPSTAEGLAYWNEQLAAAQARDRGVGR